MSVFVSAIILILVALTLASMQLAPGVFMLFYHYTLGKSSAKKACALSPYFILGYATFFVAVWFIIYSLIFIIFYHLPIIDNQIFTWALAGALLAESILSLILYYRKGKFTTLFISRRTAKALEIHAKNSKNRTDVFTLGFLSGFPELLFTFPLFVLSSVTLMKISYAPRIISLVLSLFAIILPLFCLLCLFCSNHNLAEVERLRIRLKPFFHLIICLSFLALAFAIINLGVNYYG